MVNATQAHKLHDFWDLLDWNSHILTQNGKIKKLHNSIHNVTEISCCYRLNLPYINKVIWLCIKHCLKCILLHTRRQCRAFAEVLFVQPCCWLICIKLDKIVSFYMRFTQWVIFNPVIFRLLYSNPNIAQFVWVGSTNLIWWSGISFWLFHAHCMLHTAHPPSEPHLWPQEWACWSPYSPLLSLTTHRQTDRQMNNITKYNEYSFLWCKDQVQT